MILPVAGRMKYIDKVLATEPIAYWPLAESSGTVAQCLTNAAMNGAYSSDVATWPVGAGIGDGGTAPCSDGTNDYANIGSAALNAAFNGDEGSVALWLKVPAAVWTDGTSRYALRLSVDASNYIHLIRSTGNNTILCTYSAGGTSKIGTLSGLSTTGWFHLGMSWSKTADEMRYYLDGVWKGTYTTLGTWAAGPFASAFVFAANATPTFQWLGWLAHPAIWASVLPDSTFTDLAFV